MYIRMHIKYFYFYLYSSPSLHGKKFFEDQSVVSEVHHLTGRGCEVSSLWKPPQRRLTFASNPTRPLLLCAPAPFIRK